MSDLIVEPEGTPGFEVVRRRAGEACVAVIHHPKGSRRWHVTYRCPVGDPIPSVSRATRKEALAAVAATIADRSDYQLGLSPDAVMSQPPQPPVAGA